MQTESLVYQVSLHWSDAERCVARLTQQGGSLGNRDRRALRTAINTCHAVSQCLRGPSDDLEMVRVAGALVEVVQPMVSRSLLVEHLVRAQELMEILLAAEPELETIALGPAQLAWLQEFLSDCCLSLLRDLATRQLGREALAVGS
jgi:nitric oxide synthase oxygenase domain/subunit